jgi:hypothetical protein
MIHTVQNKNKSKSKAFLFSGICRVTPLLVVVVVVVQIV